ncbi:hypothetical protein EKK58_03755 [Candidatus Dependentiae bacterium]|nr:MAG: hypothetical protein EKK58_03755 [Candidatus Dependentiae bacterium]
MVYKIGILSLSTLISVHALFSGKDPFMVHFDEFDDIITQMKSFRKELETLEQQWETEYTKNQPNSPTITCKDNQNSTTITIEHIPLMEDQKEIPVNAHVGYNKDDHANNISITIGLYKIDIQYHQEDRYLLINTTYQAEAKKEDQKIKQAQTFHYSGRKGQTVIGNLELEKVAIQADHAKNCLCITIPKAEVKSKQKKIEVTKV